LPKKPFRKTPTLWQSADQCYSTGVSPGNETGKPRDLKPILTRLLQAIVVLLIVSALTFALLAATGGDALTALADDPHVSESTVVGLRRIYGLDQPLSIRYAHWLADVARGRLGDSFYYHAPVAQIIWPRFVRTVALASAALLIAWPAALLIGILAARRPRTWIDRLCNLSILSASSAPRLVLALAALAITTRISLPGADNATSDLTPTNWVLRLLPPAIVLCVPLIALFLAQTRESVSIALDQEFVRAARAKGLPERLILRRHVLRPALNPLISIFGYSLGGVMSGSVIVEKVLDWPGLGQLSVIAVQSRDVPLLMGIVLITATAVLAGNLFADVLLRVNDPRLR
jgi:peptide/nickel transport system permease protein